MSIKQFNDESTEDLHIDHLLKFIKQKKKNVTHKWVFVVISRLPSLSFSLSFNNILSNFLIGLANVFMKKDFAAFSFSFKFSTVEELIKDVFGSTREKSMSIGKKRYQNITITGGAKI